MGLRRRVFEEKRICSLGEPLLPGTVWVWACLHRNPSHGFGDLMQPRPGLEWGLREGADGGQGESLQGWPGELVNGEGMDRVLHVEKASQYLIPHPCSSGKCSTVTQEPRLGAGYLQRGQNPQTLTISVRYKKCHRRVW